MKAPLKTFTVAVTGDFGSLRTIEKIRQWIQVNGGTFSSKINPNVTHLICSKKHFRKNSKMVQFARQFSSVKIVSFDWLEDTLIAMKPCKEREYLMSTRTRAQKDVQRKKAAIREKNVKKGMETFERVCKEFEKEMYSSGYSIYHDHTNYAYDITLVRVNLLANTNERHVLKLYESNATPRLYACFEKHSKPGDGPAANILAPIGSSFDVALDHFKKFFRLKTGKEWDDRFEDVASLQGAFKFATPKLGEAKGVMQDDGLLVDVIDDLDFVERGPNRK